MIRKAGIIVMGVFYIMAGINHFRHPDNYYAIIPPYLHYINLINIISGLTEIAAGALVFLPSTRKFATNVIILMLLAFIPAHIYMLQTGWCIKSFCLPLWALWLRLLVLQPLLIYWAWKIGKTGTNNSL